MLLFEETDVKTLSKGAMAAIGVAVVGVAVLAGGYIASMAAYDTLIAKAQSSAEAELNNLLKAQEIADTPVKVQIVERNYGLLKHKLALNITSDENKISIPFTATICYAGFDYDFDLTHAKINGEYAVKELELNTLTSLTGTGHTSLIAGTTRFDIGTSFLNDDTGLKYLANYGLPYHKDNGKVLTDPTVDDIKADIGYRPEGNASLVLEFGSDEQVKVSFEADNITTEILSVSDLRFFSDGHGISAVKSFGESNISAGKLFVLDYDPLVFNQVALKLDSSRVSTKGNFDWKYELKAERFLSAKDLNISGTLQGLNIKLFNNPELFTNTVSYLEQNPLTLSIDKGSNYSFTIPTRVNNYAPVVGHDVNFAFAGQSKLSLAEGVWGPEPSLVGQYHVSFDQDVSKLQTGIFASWPELFSYFVVKNDRSEATLDFNGLSQGNIDLKINGQEFPIF